MKGFGFILVLFFCHGAHAAEDAVEHCLIKLLKKYFSKQPVLLITDLTPDREPVRRSLIPNLEAEEIVGKLMSKRRWPLQVYNTDKYLGLPDGLKLDRLKNCLFFIRPEVLEEEMDRLYRNQLWNPTGRTLVVVKAELSSNDSEVIAKRIIDRMWTRSRSVHNLVMVPEDSGDINFFTWFPYRQPDCGRVRKIVRLDTYRRGRFRLGAHLFPEKVQNNLEGCEMIAASESCTPYVFADPNNSSHFVDGLEVYIMNALSRMLNFRLVTVRPSNMWTTSVNGSLTGAFKLLVEQKIDMAFSCLMLNRERYLLAKALPTYCEDSLVWFVPSPTIGTHVADIFFAFPVDFWLLMFAVMSAAIALVVPLAYVETAGQDWCIGAVGNVIRLIGLSVYAPITFPAKKFYLRIFAFLFFLYSMHITIAFQSSLFALYRQPQYSRSVSSLEEAVDAGLFVYLRSSAMELYNQSDHALWNRILRPGHFDYLQNFDEAFSQIAYDKTAIALYIKTTGIYLISVYYTDEYGNPEIRWLHRRFSPYPVTGYLSPGHPFHEAFERSINILISSGLVLLWLRRSVMGGRMRIAKDRYANRPLTMTHMGGAFFLLLVMLGIAILAFLGEIFLHLFRKKIKIRQKPPHRHFFVRVKSNFDVVTVARIGHGNNKY